MSQTPSTSGVQISNQNRSQSSRTVRNGDDELTLRCLDIVSKIAGLLKTETDGFITVLENILALSDGKGVEEKKQIFDLIETVMSNILDADIEELNSAKQHFQKLFSPRGPNSSVLINMETVIALQPLDESEFSSHFLGKLCLPNGIWKEVLLKRSKSPEYDSLIDNEARVLSELKHKNILGYYGIHSSRPELVLECMDLFNLPTAVHTMNFTTDNILKLLYDVANGMEFLISKKYLHRNLMINDVFLNTKKQCKIGGFQFAVNVKDSNGVYYMEKVHPFDRYFMPPEIVFNPTNDKEFTAATDVWSMGIVIWELFYIVEHSADVKRALHDKKELIGRFILKTEILSKSKLCPKKLHDYVIDRLLNRNCKERDSFSAVKAKLKEIMAESKK